MGTAQGSAEVQYTYQVVPTASAGTPASAPHPTPVAIPPFSWLWRVEVRIPAGHQGVTGLALVDAGQYVLPYSVGGPAWLIGDNDLLEYPYDAEVGANVTFLAYNTGAFDHAWQCRLIYTPVGMLSAGPAVLVSPDVSAWLAEIAPAGE